MGISRITTEKVKERADIEEVVNDYVPLKKKGQNLWACCPFHNEKSPSFSVSPAKQIYKCFGCGKAGDPIQFVMDIEGIGFNEAIRHLAQKYAIEIEEDKAVTPADIEAYNEKESLYISLGFAKDFFVQNLKTEEGMSIGLSYFKERGFNPAIIEKFDLGYALNGWDHLMKAALSAGFSNDVLLKSGLILEKESDPGHFYDRFRGRVTFTIHNLGGKAVGFGARILTQDKKQPKYINSPETEVYHKSDVLYGMYQAKKSVREKDNCYLVEGYTDVISMHLSGIENVVSSSGTSLTENQIKIIKRFTDNVTVLYDGDEAGIKASLRGIDMLLEGGLNVKAVVFPDGNDPDSYSRKVGSQEFRDYLEKNSQDFIAFKIGLFAEESAADPIKRAETIRQVVQSLSKIPDPIIRTVYIRQSANLLGIEEEIVQVELNKILLKAQKGDFFRNQREESETPFEDLLPVKEKSLSLEVQFEEQEREAIRILILYGFENVSEDLKACEYLFREIVEINFKTPVFNRLLKMYKDCWEEGILPQPDYFLNTEDAEVKKEIIGMLLTRRHEVSSHWKKKHQINTSDESDDLSKTFYRVILYLKRIQISYLLFETGQKVSEGVKEKVSDEEISLLQKVHMELNKIQNQIDHELGSVIGKRTKL